MAPRWGARHVIGRSWVRVPPGWGIFHLRKFRSFQRKPLQQSIMGVVARARLAVHASTFTNKSFLGHCLPSESNCIWPDDIYILSYLILSCLVLPCLVLPCLVSSHLISSHLISSHLSSSHLILSYLILGVSVLHLSLVILVLCLPYDVVRAQIVRLDPTIDIITVPEVVSIHQWPNTAKPKKMTNIHWPHES